MTIQGWPSIFEMVQGNRKLTPQGQQWFKRLVDEINQIRDDTDEAAENAASPIFPTRAAAGAATIPASQNALSLVHNGVQLDYRRDLTGTALTTAGGVNWSPAGPVFTEGHWGAPNDGVNSDTAALQAAVDFLNATRAGVNGRSCALMLGPVVRLTGMVDASSTGGRRASILGLGGGGMPLTRVICDFNGYGTGAVAPAAFSFGSETAPAYQSGMEIAGLLFERGPNCERAPIGIRAAAFAQTTIHDITFGSWNNECISLLTPQNVKGENIVCFGGGRSFPAKTAAGITVTQAGTTLTASAPVFSAADVGKTAAIWGVGASTSRRKALITGYTSSTVVTVAETFTDATPRRLFFGSAFISATAGSTTITADAAIFGNLDGLPVFLEGVGPNSGVMRARIVASSGNTATLSEPAGTTTTTGKIATAALALFSPASFGNGASDIRLDRVQIESHQGIALGVQDADIFHLQGKLHASQSGGSEAAVWASRWEGSFDGDFDAQYVGAHRMVIGDQTSSLRLRPMRLRTAINERSFRIRPRALTFEGSIVAYEGIHLVGAASGTRLSDVMLDDNALIPGYVLDGLFDLNQADQGRAHLGNRVYATNAGMFFGEGDALSRYLAPAGWTPVIADASTGGNVATGTFEGFWMQVGALTIVSCRLLNINTTGLTAGNSLFVRGLPDNIRPNPAFAFTGGVRTENITLTSSLAAFADDNDRHVLFYQNMSGAASAPLLVSALTSGTASIRFSMVYITD